MLEIQRLETAGPYFYETAETYAGDCAEPYVGEMAELRGEPVL
jgi:hypothetical protein